jgi:hypothetical protein
MLDYPLHASGISQNQVRELLTFVSEAALPSHPAIICGSFNPGPDCDEIRMLTGRSQPVGAENPVILCDLGIFTDQAAGPVPAARVGRCRARGDH